MIPYSELLIRPEGTIYHLNLSPGQIAKDIILVGDPDRVAMVAENFTEIEFTAQNREFVTTTGIYQGKRITVMSTGIGVGNIDIALNELDALVNIDFKSRTIKRDLTQLNIVRIGTCGALQSDAPLGSYILTEKAIGLDGLLNFHKERDTVADLDLEADFQNNFPELATVLRPYVIDASEFLLGQLSSSKTKQGVTITAPGFYGSQGRALRMPVAMENFNDKIESYRYNMLRIVNYEMETSALLAYSKLLGHNATTICLAIANRPLKDAMEEYNSKMKDLITYTLEAI